MRDVKGYEGIYGITSCGRIWSYRNEMFLKPKITKDGYLKVKLCKNGKMKHICVHRLVAMAYIPNPENLPEVDHKDNNKTNNCVNNLQWLSHKDNTRKSCNKAILQFTLYGEFVREWPSATDVGREVRTNIVQCLRGKNKSALGYKWFYKDDITHLD